MDIGEFFVLCLCVILSCLFLYRWYNRIYNNWHPEQNQMIKNILALLPLIALAVIIYTLDGLASFDVVGNAFWTFFYVILGYAWIYTGLTAMSAYFDISWTDDVINLKNKSALAAVAGGYLGIAIIYSGANIGDGPGRSKRP